MKNAFFGGLIIWSLSNSERHIIVYNMSWYFSLFRVIKLIIVMIFIQPVSLDTYYFIALCFLEWIFFPPGNLESLFKRFPLFTESHTVQWLLVLSLLCSFLGLHSKDQCLIDMIGFWGGQVSGTIFLTVSARERKGRQWLAGT